MTANDLGEELSFNYRLRRFNKRYFNRFSMGLAGRPGSPWSVIEHRGRVSGRPYNTPVVARQLDGQFVIPLPYGVDVDWCQNVLAAGEATVISGGHAYRAVEPAIIPSSEALPAFPDWMQKLSAGDADDEYLRLRRVAEDPGAYGHLAEMYPTRNSLAVLAAALGLVVLLVRLGKIFAGPAAEPQGQDDSCC